MKQTKPQDKPQQPAFICFLALLFSIIIISACGPWLQGLSALQISLGLALILLVGSLVLWLVLRHWLRTQQSRYQSLYQRQLRDKLNVTVNQNGTLTDSTGPPLPRSPHGDVGAQAISNSDPKTG